MEGEEIGMVLARASELRSKFGDRIAGCSAAAGEEGQRRRGAVAEEEEEEEAESLINIRDAFESLEQQLSGLQALEQQQRYEREASLAQIDRSRMILLSKLKEYKGDDLEVIQEALAFAGGTLEQDDDLLLPPYPSHLPDLFVLDGLYTSSRFPLNKSSVNGRTSNLMHEAKNCMNGTEEKQCNEPPQRNASRGIRFVFGLVAKSVLAAVGVASVLSLAGFKPVLRKGSIQFRIAELFPGQVGEESPAPTECPPGKVLVVEDGKARCLVKERVEIPFDLDVTAPKISYGFG